MTESLENYNLLDLDNTDLDGPTALFIGVDHPLGKWWLYQWQTSRWGGGKERTMGSGCPTSQVCHHHCLSPAFHDCKPHWSAYCLLKEDIFCVEEDLFFFKWKSISCLLTLIQAWFLQTWKYTIMYRDFRNCAFIFIVPVNQSPALV